ncbi:hypothetical protein PIB30_024657 [Stylosanthes scabra]|uniref:Late embryogenesis abundant protein LEA-2 subgroup domain-containing protein n=1 Tax=Stylosanthes scabra TaxID=79078 RepID=A0ABU6YA47_9FABA|nr:hypothetical protein [Stylosanthes scabra]
MMIAKPQRPPPSGGTNLASCCVATIFLVFILIAIFLVYFILFRPQDPKIAVSAVQLPSFSFSASNATANFTFSQYASVTNPNRATFSHYDSSLQLLYSGNQVGFMFIPAGTIDAQTTKYMAATFHVQSFPLSPPSQPLSVGPTAVSSGGVIGRVGPTMEMESRISMAGRVKVLHLFSHHVEAKARCIIAVSVTDGSVIDLVTVDVSDSAEAPRHSRSYGGDVLRIVEVWILRIQCLRADLDVRVALTADPRELSAVASLLGRSADPRRRFAVSSGLRGEFPVGLVALSGVLHSHCYPVTHLNTKH